MAKIFRKLLRVCKNIVTSNIVGDYESEAVRKAIVINLFSLIAIVFMIFFGIRSLLIHNIEYMIIIFISALLTTSFLVYLRITKNVMFAAYGLILLMTLLEYYFIIEGIEKATFLWYYIYPTLCLYTLGLKRGGFFLSFLFTTTLALFVIKPDFFPVYSHNMALRFFSSFITLSFMAIIYEFIREATYKALEKQKDTLEFKVQERTAELEVAKLKAEESDRLKSAFLANMSHEIRTPMNAIIGFSNLIIAPDIEQDLKREMISHIVSSTNSLLHLMEDIIDLSRIETGQFRMNFRMSNISSVMTGLFDSYSNKKGDSTKNNIQLFYDNEKENEPLNFITDSIRVNQILSYLLDNAFKFTEKGEIHFGYERILKGDKELIQFYVKDTGIGISDDQKKIIFKRFTKAEATKIKLYRGAGLGLSISKNLVEFLGGEIWFDSTIERETTFFFTVPFVSSEKEIGIQLATKEVTEEINWKNKFILIADSEEGNFLLLKSILSKTNATFYYVNNGEDAIEFIKNNDVDIVLMDLKMTVMNGVEAKRIIKSMGKKIPIIALTAFELEQNEKITIDTGCDAYIAKSLKEAYLLKVLNEFLT